MSGPVILFVRGSVIDERRFECFLSLAFSIYSLPFTSFESTRNSKTWDDALHATSVLSPLPLTIPTQKRSYHSVPRRPCCKALAPPNLVGSTATSAALVEDEQEFKQWKSMFEAAEM